MTEPYSDDPLMPHLFDILSDPASEGLILGGGFGMRMKQSHIARTGARTLIESVPPARATQDLDFFLRMEMFVKTERGKAFRALLDRLDYEVVRPKMQFGKPFDEGQNDADDRKVKVDLLARRPVEGENVKVKGDRVGEGSGTDLHGRDTPEAFAIDDAPIPLNIEGRRTDGGAVKTTLLVPHPYAWLNMKVKAAHDWLHMTPEQREKKPNSEKHAFDVYVLIAMLMEEELSQATTLAVKYSANSVAQANKEHIVELYGSAEAPGVLEVRRQTGGARIDYELFYEVLRNALNA